MMNSDLPNFDDHNHPHQSVEVAIAQERLRQARYSFNVTLALTTVCTVIGLTGVGLLLMGKVPEGVIATTGGMSPIIPCIQFARDSNDRLDQILKELKDDA